MEQKEKRFVTPNAEIVEFTTDDIITVSVPEGDFPIDEQENDDRSFLFDIQKGGFSSAFFD